MAARPFGSTGNEQPTSGSDLGDASKQPSILDLGSATFGDEPTADESITGDASGPVRSTPFIDPTTLGSDADAPFGRFASGKPRKRAPNGTRNGGGYPAAGKSTRREATEISSFVADILYGVHEIAAKLTKVEELELSEDESKALSEAIVKVTQQYDVPLPDPKVMVWVNLCKVAGMVYGPRFVAAKARKRREKQGPQAVRFPGQMTG